jgi:hypothetical protein
MLCVSPVAPGIPGDSEQKETGAKLRQGCQDFLVLVINLWAQVELCFLATALSTCQTMTNISSWAAFQ